MEGLRVTIQPDSTLAAGVIVTPLFPPDDFFGRGVRRDTARVGSIATCLFLN
jgi:hypothetical protein